MLKLSTTCRSPGPSCFSSFLPPAVSCPWVLGTLNPQASRSPPTLQVASFLLPGVVMVCLYSLLPHKVWFIPVALPPSFLLRREFAFVFARDESGWWQKSIHARREFSSHVGSSLCLVSLACCGHAGRSMCREARMHVPLPSCFTVFKHMNVIVLAAGVVTQVLTYPEHIFLHHGVCLVALRTRRASWHTNARHLGMQL